MQKGLFEIHVKSSVDHGVGIDDDDVLAVGEVLRLVQGASFEN